MRKIEFCESCGPEIVGRVDDEEEEEEDSINVTRTILSIFKWEYICKW